MIANAKLDQFFYLRRKSIEKFENLFLSSAVLACVISFTALTVRVLSYFCAPCVGGPAAAVTILFPPLC